MQSSNICPKIMINDSNKSSQNMIQPIIQPYGEVGMTRRNFMKYVGLAGATAGLGAMGGCMALPVTVMKDIPNWNDYPKTSSMFEREPIDQENLKITDFLLKEEELYGLKTSGKGMFLEKWEEMLPSMGVSKEYSLLIKQGAPQCKNWIIGSYLGMIGSSYHKIQIVANEFKTEEDFEKAKKLAKKIGFPLDKKEYAQCPYFYYSKSPFLTAFLPILSSNDNEYIKLDHITRSKKYQKLRGLELVAGTY